MANRRLRVPREDGSILAVPALDAWPRMLGNNLDYFAKSSVTVGGMPLPELRVRARGELWEAAAKYHERFGEPGISRPAPSLPWVVSGHQPELYHPGVWIKNFAVAALAEHAGGFGVHVIVDNDTMKRASILVPAGRPDAPFLARIPFDRWESEIPFEERQVVDPSVLGLFADEVERTMAEYPFRPMVGRYWERVLAAGSATTNVGERLAAGRRALERQRGCQLAEVPLGLLCHAPSFRLLAAEILRRLPDFLAIHNQELESYRRANRVRSRHHPVPELERDSDTWEAPFWIWSSARPARRHLFVREDRDHWTFLAGNERIASLSRSATSSAAELAVALGEGLGDWKLRPRALFTTLYLRLLISDLFVHGVGGGKYDELTDQIIARFFGVAPPEFTILSGTALLPTGAKGVDDVRKARLARVQRDFQWNPDRYLDDTLREQEPISEWIEEKHGMFDLAGVTRAERRTRFEHFRAINQRLRRYLGKRPEDVRRELVRLNDASRSAGAIRSREFAFCLFPDEGIDPLTRQITF